MAKKTGEAEYEFSLVLSGVSTLDDRVANALFEAGCDDAGPSGAVGASPRAGTTAGKTSAPRSSATSTATYRAGTPPMMLLRGRRSPELF